MKQIGEDGRVFSNYFANVITDNADQRIISPMRYRVRPRDSLEEIPTKYNVFNARIDSLENRKTWSTLFMKKHGIIPFTHFFEWVEGKNKKPTLISFFPEKKEMMWAPVLYDTWQSQDNKITMNSFAIITDGPPEEIKKMGHDRCPIFLAGHQIDSWLNPQSKTKNEIYKILNQREDVIYAHQFM